MAATWEATAEQDLHYTQYLVAPSSMRWSPEAHLTNNVRNPSAVYILQANVCHLFLPDASSLYNNI